MRLAQSKEETNAKKLEWDREHRKLVRFRLRTDVPEEARVLDWLGRQPNMTSYLKNLILADMSKTQD